MDKIIGLIVAAVVGFLVGLFISQDEEVRAFTKKTKKKAVDKYKKAKATVEAKKKGWSIISSSTTE